MEALMRLGVLVGLALLIVCVWLLLRTRQARVLAQTRGELLFQGLVPIGKPVVVAFSTPGCVVCRAQQAPALDQLAARVAGCVAVARLSVVEHSELAERLGILTVPTTVILDAQGRVQQINHGFRDAARLAAQLQPLLDAAPTR